MENTLQEEAGVGSRSIRGVLFLIAVMRVVNKRRRRRGKMRKRASIEQVFL